LIVADGGETQHPHHQNLTEKGEGVVGGKEQIHEAVTAGVVSETSGGDDTREVLNNLGESDRVVRADLIGDASRRKDTDQIVDTLNTKMTTGNAVVGQVLNQPLVV